MFWHHAHSRRSAGPVFWFASGAGRVTCPDVLHGMQDVEDRRKECICYPTPKSRRPRTQPRGPWQQLQTKPKSNRSTLDDAADDSALPGATEEQPRLL